MVTPDLSLLVPNTRARLWITVVNTSQVKFAIQTHVTFKVLQLLLVGVLKALKRVHSQIILSVESVLVSEKIFGRTVDKLLRIGNCEVDPV